VAERARTSPATDKAHEVDVSVVVPMLNEESHIRDSASAMLQQRFEGTIEFLFVDGRSDDRTRDILEELARRDARIRVLDNPRRQTPSALNIGLRNARGEFVVRMDAHAYYPSDYVANAVTRLRRGDVACVCGPQVPFGTGEWSQGVALALGSRLGTAGSPKWPSEGDGGGPAAGERELGADSGVFGGAWRRSTLEAQGGWDEGWPLNQDCELHARITAAGGRTVMLPELGARYAPRDSLTALARQYWRYGQYREKTALAHPETMRPAHLLTPGLAVTVVASVLAPRPLRRAARAGLLLYAATVGIVSARTQPSAGWRGALRLPLVFAVMHLAWGFGYLLGFARFGPPLAAFIRVLRILCRSTSRRQA
jgi:succinoglycan biosynthesis protein ExoA